MKTNPLFFIFFIILSFSCKENKELMFLRDKDYMEPSIRIRDTINNSLTYGLYERYFVYGYNYNKEYFVDSVLNFICSKINQELIISRIDITFHDIGKYGFHKEGKMYDGITTDFIASFIWDVKKPSEFLYISNEYEIGEFINFPCSLKYKIEDNRTPLQNKNK